MEIEHEGKKYILKEQVESIIKERVSKVAQRATEGETRIKELENLLSEQASKQTSYDVLSQQVLDLQNKLEISQNKYQRYMTMSQYGITDQDLIDVIEWQYNKSIKDKPKKEQVPLEQWFQTHLDNPAEAPVSLRPHLKSLKPVESSVNTEDLQAIYEKELGLEGIQHRESMQAINPPITNRNAVPAPEGKDIIKTAMSDQNFYNQNVDAIRQAWFARYGRK